MLEASVYIHEFLYRGTDPGDETSTNAWQVTLKSVTPDLFGGVSMSERTMSATQAESVGYDLTTIIEMLNTETLKRCEDLEAQVAALTAERDALKDDKAQLNSQLSVMSLPAE